MFAELTWVRTGTADQLQKDKRRAKVPSAGVPDECRFRNAAAVLAAALLCAALPFSQPATAQVQVVESQPTVRDRNTYPTNSPQTNRSPATNTQTTYPQASDQPGSGVMQPMIPITEVTPTGNGGGTTTGDLYHQFQVMQQEVTELRGAVEELVNEVKKLKQQRLDDYVELDNRISGLGQQGGVAPRTPSDSGGIQNTPDIGSSAVVASADERTNYQNAIQLLLEKKDYDGAIAAFNNHLVRFPGGQYEGNALFWLGQIYVIQQKNQQAVQSYSTLINKFPTHDKLWEAKFALGKVYFSMGDRAKAKTLVQEVANSNSDVARLARNFLDDNLSS